MVSPLNMASALSRLNCLDAAGVEVPETDFTDPLCDTAIEADTPAAVPGNSDNAGRKELRSGRGVPAGCGCSPAVRAKALRRSSEREANEVRSAANTEAGVLCSGPVDNRLSQSDCPVASVPVKNIG